MDFDQFINNTINSQIDYDGFYGFQCVDLFRAFCKIVLKIEQPENVNGAKDFFINYKKMPIAQKYFKRYGKYTTPKYKDIIIWDKTETNQYGHIAICVNKIDKQNCLVFEQIGYSKIGKDKALLNIRGLKNHLGLLRIK